MTTMAVNRVHETRAYEIGTALYDEKGYPSSQRLSVQVTVTGWSAPLDFNGRYQFNVELRRDGKKVHEFQMFSALMKQDEEPPFGAIVYSAINFMIEEKIDGVEEAVVPVDGTGDLGIYCIKPTFLIPDSFDRPTQRHGYKIEEVVAGAYEYQGQDTRALHRRRNQLEAQYEGIEEQIRQLQEKLEALSQVEPFLDAEIFRREEIVNEGWEEGDNVFQNRDVY